MYGWRCLMTAMTLRPPELRILILHNLTANFTTFIRRRLGLRAKQCGGVAWAFSTATLRIFCGQLAEAEHDSLDKSAIADRVA